MKDAVFMERLDEWCSTGRIHHDETQLHTDADSSARGVLTVKSLMIDRIKKAAGSYTSATEKWIEGKGKLVVQP